MKRCGPFKMLLLSALALASCNSESPREVTRKFWQAYQLEDKAPAISLATRESRLDLEKLHAATMQPLDVELGEAVPGKRSATVVTSLTPRYSDAVEPTEFLTTLELEPDGWRVNYPATARAMERAARSKLE